MKLLRNMGIVFLSIILVNLIGLFVLSYQMKPLLVNGIIKETIMNTYLKKPIDTSNIENNENLKNVDKEALQEILKSKEVEELMNKYIDITMNSLTSDKELEDLNMEKDIFDYIKNNKEKLEKAIGENISNEMIEQVEEQMKSKELTKSYKEAIENEKRNMDPTFKKILNSFTFFTSKKFRLYCLIAIILNLLLIILLQFSLYKWMRVLGTSMIVSGSGLTIIGLVVSFVIKKLTTFNLNLIDLIISGCVLIIIGIIFIIIFKIISKLLSKKKVNNNVISEEII